MKKKLASLVLSATMVLSLAACGQAPSGDDVYTVGIIQQLEHQALDAATEGFKDALTEILGDKVTFEYDNAQNDQNNCTTIANKYVSGNVDLIMANGTTALQSAAAATSDIPIVGTSITDYITAGVLVGDNDAPGGNVTGASDLAPIDQQIALLLELCPDAKTVGVLYCSSEPNSKYQADKATEQLVAADIEVKEYTISDSNDIQAVVSSAVEQVDAIYIPTDNTVADNMGLVKNITIPAGIPTICGEENMCSKGGLATLSISYYDMGHAAGELAANILTGKAEPASSPIVYVSKVTRKYNAEVAELLDWEIPEGIEAIG